MQYQVPQFIETEDKLLGPFTVRQFIYVGGAAGLLFILFFLLRTGVWIAVTLVVTAATLTLALGKINGRTMISVATSAFFFYWQPQTYLWQPDVPGVEKGEVARQSGFSLDTLVAGLALKNAWRTVQTGSKGFVEEGRAAVREIEERYEIVHRLSGDQRAAHRIDYR